MFDVVKTLIAQALELPPAERSMLAEKILLSLDPRDPEIDAVTSATPFGVN